MSSLSISIIEQPTEYHRFRYETEVVGGKLGGVLYGRHGNKSCVRLRVTGIDPLQHQSIIVIGGTVNPEGFPHPYFMVGDSCSDGAFQFRKEVAALGGKTELEITLEKVSLVCVSTKGEKLAEAIGNRKRINFNPCNKDMDSVKYNSRNMKSVRLVFQIYYQNFESQAIATSAIVVSDTITDARQQAKLGIFGVHPGSLSVGSQQDVWVYFDDQLPHTDKGMFTAEIQSSEQGVLVQAVVKEAKKHLLIIGVPDLTPYFANCNERVKCDLVVKEHRSAVTDSHEILVLNSSIELSALFAAEPLLKRKRAALPSEPVQTTIVDYLTNLS